MNTNNKSIPRGVELIISVAACTLLIWFDQFTKALAVDKLQTGPFVIWDGVFEFHYTINKGAAFGIFQNQRMYFLIVTLILLAGIFYTYWRMPSTKKYLFMRANLVLLTAGAIGNFIDRLTLEYVIDFLYFKVIDFPIFNVADCYVCIAAFFLFVAIMFYYKDSDFACLIPKRWQKEKTEAEKEA